jgi:hypothetical protein
MRIDAVVINASPLISLFRSGQADLLPRLFGHIVVPEAVWNEVALDEWEDAVARELGAQTWPVRASVEISPRVLPLDPGPFSRNWVFRSKFMAAVAGMSSILR